MQESDVVKCDLILLVIEISRSWLTLENVEQAGASDDEQGEVSIIRLEDTRRNYKREGVGPSLVLMTHPTLLESVLCSRAGCAPSAADLSPSHVARPARASPLY